MMMFFQRFQNYLINILILKYSKESVILLKVNGNLNWGVNWIKFLAAVAPLLGLLGTVIGMIETFQAITVFGTGDPKQMAGGISQALVTTMLGLIFDSTPCNVHLYLKKYQIFFKKLRFVALTIVKRLINDWIRRSI